MKKKKYSVWHNKPASLASYISIVTEIQEKWVSRSRYDFNSWYRGVPNCNYPLMPSACRGNDGREEEDEMRNDFRMKAHPFLSEATYPPKTDWDYYFLMQHHGLPTRLLDWTEGSFLALYFAIRDENEGDPAVWVLNPWAVNQKLSKIGDIICQPGDRKIKRFLPKIWSNGLLPRKPAALQPPFNSKRISAQKGVFTIHGSSKKGLEEYSQLKGHLMQIIIPRKYVEKIRKQLNSSGITESTIFPDLDGLCKELKDTWKNEC